MNNIITLCKQLDAQLKLLNDFYIGDNGVLNINRSLRHIFSNKVFIYDSYYVVIIIQFASPFLPYNANILPRLEFESYTLDEIPHNEIDLLIQCKWLKNNKFVYPISLETALNIFMNYDYIEIE